VFPLALLGSLSRINKHGAQAQIEIYSGASSSVAIARTGPWDLPGGMGRARCSRDGQDALTPDCQHYPRDEVLGLGWERATVKTTPSKPKADPCAGEVKVYKTSIASQLRQGAKSGECTMYWSTQSHSSQPVLLLTTCTPAQTFLHMPALIQVILKALEEGFVDLGIDLG